MWIFKKKRIKEDTPTNDLDRLTGVMRREPFFELVQELTKNDGMAREIIMLIRSENYAQLRKSHTPTEADKSLCSVATTVCHAFPITTPIGRTEETVITVFLAQGGISATELPDKYREIHSAVEKGCAGIPGAEISGIIVAREPSETFAAFYARALDRLVEHQFTNLLSTEQPL